MSDFVVGIDLGTTNTCVSIYLNGNIQLLENEEGKSVTPSFVFLADIEKDKMLVGPYAKKMADNKPQFGVYEFKRLIGRDFNETTLQNNLQYYPFHVEADEDGKCLIVIEQNGTNYKKSIEEITSILLQKVKKDVSAKMKSPVDKAVITVPAYFNHHQREATLKAAKMAGFTTLKLLNEPTAAALNYFQQRQTPNEESLYLVFDLGGGTFDITIFKKQQNRIEIVAVDGDSYMGGCDFDVLITDYVCDYLRAEYNFNARDNKRSMKRLQTKSEEAKKTLSFVEETEIILEGFVPGQDAVIITLTRRYFEAMALPLFKKSIQILDLCLKLANIEKDQIKAVILSGGSTRIPKIQEMISEFFDGITLEKFLNPDLCVANGASVQAALFSQNPEQNIDSMEIQEVTPLSIGSKNWVSEMKFIIKRNTQLPATGQVTYRTANPQQETMVFSIYEGERTDVRKNHLLGAFRISNLTAAPPGQCEVILTLNIDQNGILTASAKEKCRDSVKEVNIEYSRRKKANAQMQNSLQDAEINKDEDEAFSKFAAKKNYLLHFCTTGKYNIEVNNLIDVYKSAYGLCERTLCEAKKYELADLSKVQELIQEVESKVKHLDHYKNFRFMPRKDF